MSRCRILCLLVLLALPAAASARTYSLSGGVSLSWDFSDRTYKDTRSDDAGTDAADTASPAQPSEDPDEQDDYSRLALTPMLQLVAEGSRDFLSLRAQPDIKYDLLESETDWNADFRVAAHRDLSRSWRLAGSNHFIQSDYYEEDETLPEDAPELSTDPGRRRYWRNILELSSRHRYGEERSIEAGFGYTALRNDEDNQDDSYDDYDRYRFSLTSEHRFSKHWQTTARLSYIRGDYTPKTATEPEPDPDASNPAAPQPAPAEPSDDVREYRFNSALNRSLDPRSTLSLSYDYIGSRYDEQPEEDGDIHQLQLAWARTFSSRLSGRLGAGPSYEKTRDREGNWGGNGIAALDYRTRYASWSFSLEKGYDVENFSGTEERGLVDYWDLELSFSYQLLQDLSVQAGAGYRYEDRDRNADPALTDTADSTAADPAAVELEEYNEQRFTARAGLSYQLLENLQAGLRYTYIRQESEREGEDYDDHRVLLSLSWQTDLLRW